MKTRGVLAALSSLILAANAHATEYLVKNNPGAGEISPAQLKAISCFNAGDHIRFKRGQSFQQYFTFKACSGSSSGVIRVGAYGTGADPRIIGSLNAAPNGYSWSYEPNPMQGGKVISFLQNTGIYRMNNLPEEVVGVVYGTEQMDFARNPNRDLGVRFRPNYFEIEATSRDVDGCGMATCVRMAPRTSGGNSDVLWMFKEYGLPSNSYVMMREENWAIKRFGLDWISPTLPSFASQTPITIPDGATDKKLDGMGAIFFGALSLLNTQKEWYFDPVDNTLYFWPPAGETPPSASKTKLIFKSNGGSVCGSGAAADRLGVLCAWGRGNVGFQFRDVQIENAASDGIRVVDSTSVLVSNVTVLRSTNYGLRVFNRSSSAHTMTSITVENSTFKFNSMAGMRLSGPSVGSSNPAIGSITITNSDITDNGFLNNQTSTDRQGFAGVRTEGKISNLDVTGNNIRRSGYALVISHPTLNSFNVSGNTISHYCIMLNDCGGLYVNASNQSTEQNHTVENNDFSLPVGNTDGTGHNTSLVAGVYIDFNGDGFFIDSNDFDGHNNFIGGVYLNGGQRNTVTNNTFNTYTPPHIGFGTNHGPNECKEGNTVIGNVVNGSSGTTSAVYDYTNPAIDSCLN